MTDTTAVDVDALLAEILLTPEGKNDPYPRYAAIREHAPAFRSAMGFTVVARYDDCQWVLRDARLGKGELGAVWESYGLTEEQWRARYTDLERRTSSMLGLDPPDHTRLRGLVAKAFTPRTVENLRPDIERLTDELLDELDDGNGVIDVMSALALPLPMAVIGEMLGIPADERAVLQPHVRASVKMLEFDPTARGDGCRGRRDRGDRRARRGADRRAPRPSDRRPAVAPRARRGVGRPARSRRAHHHGDAAVRRRVRDDHQPHRQRPARAARPPRPAAAPPRRPHVAEVRSRGAAPVGLPGAARRARALRGRRAARRGLRRRPAVRDADRRGQPRPAGVRRSGALRHRTRGAGADELRRRHPLLPRRGPRARKARSCSTGCSIASRSSSPRGPIAPRTATRSCCTGCSRCRSASARPNPLRRCACRRRRPDRAARPGSHR